MSTHKPSGSRRTEIVTATLDLAFEVGPDHVTTGMIASRLGLTQPAIYKHFPKKENVWQAAGEVLCAKIRENTELGRSADRDPLTSLRQMVLGHLHLVTETPALPEIMVSRDPTGALAEARRNIQTEISEFRAALTGCFKVAQKKGHLRTEIHPEDGVMLLFGIIQSLVLRLIVTRNITPLLQDGERLLDLQLKLFANKGNDA